MLRRRKPLARYTRLRYRSKKTAAKYVERRVLVAELFLYPTVCEVPDCTERATDPHEPLTRARGGSILDRENVLLLCRSHHRWAHDHPAEAEASGLLVHSWDGSLGGRIARVVWAEGLGPVPRRITQNTPVGISDEGAHQSANDRQESSAMSSIPEAEHRARVIDGLRLLATYLDDHPDVPVGYTPVSLEFSASASRSDEEACAEVDRVASMLGAVTETSSRGTYSASKCFGAAAYRVYAAPKAETSRVNAGLSYLDSVTPESEAS